MPLTSRENIRQKLQELASAVPAKAIGALAMCYDMAGPSQNAEYLCPKCGMKTLYAKPAAAPLRRLLAWVGLRRSAAPVPAGARPADRAAIEAVEFDIPAAQRILHAHASWAKDLELDASEFCQHCGPQVPMPQLALVARYPGEPHAHRVAPVTADDLLLIQEFFEGVETHEVDFGAREPLQRYVPRLALLLGVSPSDVKRGPHGH